MFVIKELKESVKEEQAEKKEAAEEKPDEPQEIVLKVDMHCEGCAKKVEKSLLRFEGQKAFHTVSNYDFCRRCISIFPPTLKHGIPNNFLLLLKKKSQSGVENVKADSRSKTVVVKSRAADPSKVCERVQRKTKRRVELIFPLPPPPEEEKKEEAPAPPPEEKKEEVLVTF